VSAAIAEFADLEDKLRDFDEALDGALGTARFAMDLAVEITKAHARRAHAERAGAGWCRAHCGHEAAGTIKTATTKDDRLHGGLCNGCRAFRDRNEIVDLAEVQRLRRDWFGKCGCEDCIHRRDVGVTPRVVE
jgi:hypothetical protein